MNTLLTAAEMRETEQRAITSGAVTGLELMERAGRGVVEAALARWSALEAPPGEGRPGRMALVLCGPGNNGGDGYVVARLLEARGWRVQVHAMGDPGRLPPDAKTNHARWAAIGPVLPLDQAPGLAECPDLIFDALFGTGLTRPVDGMAALVGQMETWRAKGARVVAVDIPSGLCADSGRYLGAPPDIDLPGDVFHADLTVTFHAAKCGHFLSSGPAACGAIDIRGIGL